MRLSRRPGFVASPRAVFPALIALVLVMFLVFASLDSQDVSAARVLGTAIVGAGILILFAAMVFLARGRRRKETDEH